MENFSLAARVRSEFIEMPGLQLTLPQAARLWGLETPVCQAVIDALVAAKFLRWTSKGRLVRADRSMEPELPPVWGMA